MRRIVGVLFAALCLGGAAVLTWPQLFRLERTFPIAQIVSFRGPLAVAFLALALIALLLAMFRAVRALALTIAAIAVVAAAANAGVMVYRGAGTDTDAFPAKTDASVRVMTWNTAGSATAPDTIASIAVAMKADIVTLPETTIETGEQVAILMRDAGSPMWAHHAEYGQYGVDGWDASSTTVLISPALGDYSVIESSQDGSSNTSTVPSAVAMPTSGSGPTVVAAHAVAPRQSYMQQWRDDLQWLADQCSAENVILAGDFNATLDHMAGMGVDGGSLGRCHDAASETGNGGVGTWTTSYPSLVGAPIDHILVSPYWRVTGSAVLTSLDTSGSDHRPLVVQLEPAG
ncbi:MULTISPECIES: endonuclease/exonuclease/phosphatase family protein [unclassified Microbacterium]|uniref:endonuclease/exonuclease/phosphatase family protein n=1 Tax=unclassified Microbacterium TaxID=2609290 RepID=UPI003744CFFC